jgi:hypothetical protein
MGSSGGGGGDTETTVRYAPYVEARHQQFLNVVANKRDAVINESPYEGYTAIPYEDAFFGSGYVMASFPSLYDMFGKFMAGLDIDTLFTQILNDSLDNTAVANAVSRHAIELSDDIEQNANPRFVTGMRDINSVLSSSFIVGKAMMEVGRNKALSKYRADLDKAMIPIAAQRWQAHIDWNKTVIMTYAELMKLYFSAAMDLDNHNYGMVVKDRLWPFTVLDYERAALGALQGASKTSTSGGEGPSTAQKAIGGALTGAAAGAMVGSVVPGVGTAVGAVVGGVIGLASGFL